MAMLLAVAVKLFIRFVIEDSYLYKRFFMAKAMESATINSKSMYQGSASEEGIPEYTF